MKVKNNYFRKCVLFLLSSYFCVSGVVRAQEGQNHARDTVITIEKMTYIHFQAALLAYQYIYSYMVKGGGGEAAEVAQSLIDAAKQGLGTEPEGSGKDMLQNILEGGEKLKTAKGKNAQQEAFAAISNTFISYFGSWPSQLIRNRLKVCRCKNGHQWLQPESSPTICPYATNKSSDCLVIVETKY
jgi:hypothetical protein